MEKREKEALLPDRQMAWDIEFAYRDQVRTKVLLLAAASGAGLPGRGLLQRITLTFPEVMT